MKGVPMKILPANELTWLSGGEGLLVDGVLVAELIDQHGDGVSGFWGLWGVKVLSEGSDGVEDSAIEGTVVRLIDEAIPVMGSGRDTDGLSQGPEGI